MESLFLRFAYAPAIAGLGTMLIIAVSLISVGAFSEHQLPQGFSSERQLLGINLLLIAMPSYMLFAYGYLLRRSRRLLHAIDALIGSSDYAGSVRTPRRYSVLGVSIGTLYAILFNLPISTLADLAAGDSLMICLILLMILVWVAVGFVLASRLHVASLFHRAGRRVPIDPYDLSLLEPFARSGMGDVALIIGALVLATVQSIDATFRYQNYLFSTIVAVPAALLLLFVPMYTLHRRLRAAKLSERAAVTQLIRTAPKSLDVEDVARLEPLLKRRDRIDALHTWPLNVAMISRLLIYGVIPPAAWIGAALVEHLVEGMLGG